MTEAPRSSITGKPFTEFFSALQAKQERLGPEFERVLFDNLWELYAR